MRTEAFRFGFRQYFIFENGAPALLTPLRIEGHTHTDFTDGRSSPVLCVRKAVDLGLETIVFAEHVRRGAPWIDDYFREMEKLKSEFDGKIRIVAGIEARVVDEEGGMDVDVETVGRAELVIGSVHGLRPLGDAIEDILHVPDGLETIEREWRMTLGLTRNPSVDVLGHPFATYEDCFGNPPVEYIVELLAAAERSGKAVELNVNHTNLKWFLDTAAGFGGDFLFWPGSDAHFADDVGKIIEALNSI